jgi:IclR family acetate operon transcriptional repressor
VLDRLAKETGELVRLALAHAGGLTWIAKSQGAQWGLRYDPDMGSPVVLHATASGRAWLASLADDLGLELVTAAGFAVPERFGRQKVRNAEELVAELRRTRQRGFGLAVEEGEPGTAAVAMAVSGQPAPATVSVAGPVIRMSAEQLETILPLLRRAVAELGELWPVVRFRIDQG